MSAPLIWIILPLGASALLWLPRNRNLAAGLGSGLTILLASTAWIMKTDIVQNLGDWSYKIASSMEFFGRRLVLTSADGPILALIFGLAAFWFAAAGAAGASRLLVPFGLAITSILVASLAVQPSLYAALLLEIAALLAVPLLASPGRPALRSVTHFLIYQTLAMPLILFSGWLLAGVEAGPGDLALVVQTGVLLSLGFALLLAIFPFYGWIPRLAEEAPPYAAGFILLIFPTAVLIFGLGFIDRFAWLRTSLDLPQVLAFVGSLMVVTGGLWAAFQQHSGRIFAYAAIIETGLSLLALSLDPPASVQIFFLLFVPRGLALGLWALSLSILEKQTSSLEFQALKGAARKSPLAAAGILLAQLSLAGLPILAGFPIRLALWEHLARELPGAAIWLLLGSLGFIASAVRTLAVLVKSPAGIPWGSTETWVQRVFLFLGWLALFILGLIPQWADPLLARLPAIFEHLIP